jgi:CDP-diacylglycerol pyrophosphatase
MWFLRRRHASPRRPSRAAVIALAAALSFVSVPLLMGAERSALWHVVHDLCVADQKQRGKPAPFESVDLAEGERNGYAILKDLFGTTQYLLIPTRRLAGIESPELLAADTPNYWHDTWAARHSVAAQAGVALPRDAVGMAINSARARSQDQLHIHIDCVRPAVRDAIAAHGAAIGETWAPLPFALVGRHYMARRVLSPDLDGVDPFRLLASGIETARRDMADETLVVIGATFNGHRPGFVLLADRADPAHGNSAHGEDLLDHDCGIAHALARGGHGGN